MAYTPSQAKKSLLLDILLELVENRLSLSASVAKLVGCKPGTSLSQSQESLSKTKTKTKAKTKNIEPGYKQGKSQVMLHTWIQQDLKPLDFSVIRINLYVCLFSV